MDATELKRGCQLTVGCALCCSPCYRLLDVASVQAKSVVVCVWHVHVCCAVGAMYKHISTYVMYKDTCAAASGGIPRH